MHLFGKHEQLMCFSQWYCYSRNNYPKSAASCAGNVIEPWLMSEAGRVCVKLLHTGVFLQSEWWGCQYLFAYKVAAVMWLKGLWDSRWSCCAKWWGLFGFNHSI